MNDRINDGLKALLFVALVVVCHQMWLSPVTRAEQGIKAVKEDGNRPARQDEIVDDSFWEIHWLADQAEGFVDLAVDHEGNSHCCFQAAAGHGLKYLYLDDAGVQRADSIGGGGAGWYASLSLDPAGAPHIAHVSGPDRMLRHAYYHDATWNEDICGTFDGPLDRDHACIDLDAGGEAPLVAYTGDAAVLRLAARVDDRWFGITVDDDSAAGWFPCVRGPVPLLVHAALGRDVLNLTYYRQGWFRRTLLDGGVRGWNDLELDAEGLPWICCRVDEGLRWAAMDGGGEWRGGFVREGGSAGYYADLAIARNQRVAVAFLDGAPGVLNFAELVGDSWRVESPNEGRDEIAACALALDGIGRPYVAFIEKQRLWLACRKTEQPSLMLAANRAAYQAGDPFELSVRIDITTSLLFADLYLMVEAGGIPLYFPGWGKSPKAQRIQLIGRGRHCLDILAFDWPNHVKPGVLEVWAVICRPTTLTPLSPFDHLTIAYN
ncbi:hypothetical protein JW905_02400 [bacterium]|nr:hypothetical protein [candidate division CSSED10-310 bacterium]